MSDPQRKPLESISSSDLEEKSSSTKVKRGKARSLVRKPSSLLRLPGSTHFSSSSPANTTTTTATATLGSNSPRSKSKKKSTESKPPPEITLDPSPEFFVSPKRPEIVYPPKFESRPEPRHPSTPTPKSIPIEPKRERDVILEVSEERVEKDENSEIELKEDHILGDTNNSRGTRVFKSKAPCLGRLWCLWDHKWVAAKRALSWIKVLVVCLFVGFLGAMYLRAISYMATGSFGYKIDRITVGDQLNLGDFFVTLVMAFLSGLSMFLTGKAFKNWTLDLILHHQSAATWNDGSNEIDYTEEESDDRSYSNDDDDDNKQIPLKVDILHGGKVHHVQ